MDRRSLARVQAGRRLILGDEIPCCAGHAIVIGPAIDDREFLAPVAMCRRRLRRLPLERGRVPRIAAGVLARATGSGSC